MPLPLGHTAIGWAAYETTNVSPPPRGEHTLISRIPSFALVAVLANLPDVDVLFGLLFHGNGAAFHRGPTHSLLFALVTGYLASHGWRLWRRIPRFGFGLCAMLVFSHVVADMLLTSAPVSLLWPLELHMTTGHNDWGQVVHMVLFQSIQDAGIVAGSVIYIAGLRFLRRKRPVFTKLAFARRRVK